MNETGMLEILRKQREFFSSHATLSRPFRLEMLGKLKSALLESEGAILAALKTELGKHEIEAFESETGQLLFEINHAIRHLGKWMRPEKVPTPLFHLPGRSEIIPEPYGVTLIIAPWNFPLQLLLVPLVGAICGGNTAILKPSSKTPLTSRVIAEMIGQYFDPAYISVLAAGREEGDFLLGQKFDLIFFTGGTEAGKHVMAEASGNLTPVVLELGGKNPCLVDKSADIRTSARRIVWGKFFNAGQDCIAPDYVYADKSIKDALVREMKTAVREFYGEDPRASASYGRIVTQERVEAMSALLGEGKIALGGTFDKESRYFSPTIIEGVDFGSKIMQGEIFGPILAVLEFTDIAEAIRNINDRPKPLALYLFTRSGELRERVLRETSSGGVCVNDTLSHFTSRYLPFGGVGQSGMGQYHGKSSFDAFSHKKSVMRKSFLIDYALRYPPYGRLTSWYRKLLEWTT